VGGELNGGGALVDSLTGDPWCSWYGLGIETNDGCGGSNMLRQP